MPVVCTPNEVEVNQLVTSPDELSSLWQEQDVVRTDSVLGACQGRVPAQFNCFFARWFDGFNPFESFAKEYPTTYSFANDLNNWLCSSACHGFELWDCKFFVFNRPYSCWVGSCDQLFNNDWFRSDGDWSDFRELQGQVKREIWQRQGFKRKRQTNPLQR